MTGRERLLTAYRGGRPDRTPVAVRGVYPFHPDWIARKHESYAPLIEYVREHADIVEFFSFDRGFLYNDLGETPRGSERRDLDKERSETRHWIETPKGRIEQLVDYSKSQRLSMVREPWVRGVDDLERVLSLPYVPPKPDLTPYHERVRAVGERGVVLGELGNAVGTVHALLDTEGLALWSHERRERVLALLELFNQRIYEFVTYLLEGGVGPVLAFNGEEYITPPLHSPRDFYEFVVPYDKRLVECIHARDRLCRIHCHGRIGKLLDGFLEIGVDALHPVEEPPMGDITLEAFRRRVGNRICIKGGVQIGDLYEKSAAEIATHCRGVIQRAGQEGALILAASASPYWPELTPAMFDNYRAMIDAAHEGGVAK